MLLNRPAEVVTFTTELPVAVVLVCVLVTEVVTFVLFEGSPFTRAGRTLTNLFPEESLPDAYMRKSSLGIVAFPKRESFGGKPNSPLPASRVGVPSNAPFADRNSKPTEVNSPPRVAITG